MKSSLSCDNTEPWVSVFPEHTATELLPLCSPQPHRQHSIPYSNPRLPSSTSEWTWTTSTTAGSTQIGDVIGLVLQQTPIPVKHARVCRHWQQAAVAATPCLMVNLNSDRAAESLLLYLRNHAQHVRDVSIFSDARGGGNDSITGAPRCVSAGRQQARAQGPAPLSPVIGAQQHVAQQPQVTADAGVDMLQHAAGRRGPDSAAGVPDRSALSDRGQRQTRAKRRTAMQHQGSWPPSSQPQISQHQHTAWQGCRS